MVQETGVAIAEKAGAMEPVSPARAAPLVITREYVDQQMRSLTLLQDMVKDILVEGRDYGRVPGTPQFLWDPGANQIFGGFNVFPGHRRIISHIEDGDKISIVIEVPLIQRNTGAEVGSGIGASSNEESKHKNRWVKEGELGWWGYTPETATSFRTKTEDGVKKYFILNPQRGELLNVCVKQASKRAEVDAAEALPGVSSTLRELFDPRKSQGKAGGKKGKEEPIDDNSPRWTKFWGEVRALGIVIEDGTPDSVRVHSMLKVPSMKDWLSRGRSLDDATRALGELVKTQRRDPASVKQEDVPDGETLENVMLQCFGWAPEQVWSEANYASRKNFEEAGVNTAWQLFLLLWDVYKDQLKPSE